MHDAETEGPPRFGSWTADELVQTAREQAGVGADEGLPDDLRFRAGVTRVIRKRRAETANADPKAPAIFLLQPTPPVLSQGTLSGREPVLDNGLSQITGRLWFVSAIGHSGHYLEHATLSDDGLFRFVTDDLGHGQTPAIWYDPRPAVHECRFYPNGLGDADACEFMNLGEADLDLERLFALIEGVYRQCLITPGAQTAPARLWANASRWWPSRSAEAVVEIYLRPGLKSGLDAYEVRSQKSMVEGRLDIAIELRDPQDPSNVVHCAILELKVLRSFTHSGNAINDADTLQRLQDGVDQAAAYRASQGSRLAALCCFDMRREDTAESCFDAVRAAAATLDVALRRWFIYSSARSYQRGRTARALAN